MIVLEVGSYFSHCPTLYLLHSLLLGCRHLLLLWRLLRLLLWHIVNFTACIIQRKHGCCMHTSSVNCQVLNVTSFCVHAYSKAVLPCYTDRAVAGRGAVSI